MYSLPRASIAFERKAEEPECLNLIPTPRPKYPCPSARNCGLFAHDLSNSIETIMQATYLLNQVDFDDANRKWLKLID